MTYRPDIDGLRAVAVLSVLFYHAHLGFPGGYVGVDIFFVISGFLITSLLVKSFENGTFSYALFWERRVRRLVPALAVVTVFTAITSYFLLLPDHLVDLGKSLIAQPLLLVNVYFWRAVKAGYFGDPPEIRPMLHTWSLGVEEQFYVVFPILLAIIYRKGPQAARPARILSCLAIASLALGIFLTPVKGVFSFFMLPTRAWELMVGGLLVFRPASSLSRTRREILGFLGMAMVGFAIFGFNDETRFPGYAAVLPCAGTALLIHIHANNAQTFTGWLLTRQWLTRIGLISYSLYLWHWPLMAYCDYIGVLTTTKARWLVVLVSCVLGHLSWRWVETPFRVGNYLHGRTAVALFFVSYALICMGLGFLYVQQKGFPKNWGPNAYSLMNGSQERSFIHEVKLDSADPELPVLGDPSAPKTTFLVWGDSHAMSMAAVMDALGRQEGLAGFQLTRSATPPLFNWEDKPGGRRSVSNQTKERWKDTALRLVDDHQLETVFLVGAWAIYDEKTFEKNLERTVAEFSARDVKVVFVQDVPTQPFDVPRRLALATRWPSANVQAVSLKEHQKRQRHVDATVAKLQQEKLTFSVVDPAKFFLAPNALQSDGRCYYRDGDHLTDLGALRLKSVFDPIFRQMSAKTNTEQRF